MKNKTIGIVGSRRRNGTLDFEKIHSCLLTNYKKGDTICSGLCPKGADFFAVKIAKELKCKTLWLPPEWKKYGKARFI